MFHRTTDRSLRTSIPGVLGVLATPALLAGAASGQSLTIYQFPGQVAGEHFGESLSTTPDLDGDGFADLLVASPLGAGGRGYVRALSGRNGTELYTLTGAAVGDSFGHAVCGLGDLDGDGQSEFAVGAPLAGGPAPGAGIAQVFSGANGSLLWTKSGDSAGDHFGWALARLPDTTGDGLSELAVGAVDDDDGGNSAGSARVFSGKGGQTLFTVHGDGNAQLFGFALAGVNDWNGDGVPDLAVGAPRFTNSSLAGFVRIHSGSDGKLLEELAGSAAGDRFGAALADVGDLDGDNLDDLLVGAPQPTGAKRGYVELYLAGAGGPAQIAMQQFGDSANDFFGSAVAPAGDIDGDGYVDVAIGAPGDDDTGAQSGSVRLISGWTSVWLDTVHGGAPNVQFGSALAALPDTNMDGHAELLVSCMGDSSVAPGAGCARVISTVALALSADEHLVRVSAPASRTLTVDFGTAHAGAQYLMFGSVSGTSPATPFGPLAIPLAKDRYYRFTRNHPNSTVLTGSAGSLDASGRATAVFTPPALTLAGSTYLGLTFHHAAVLYDLSGTPTAVSNVVPVTLVP